MLAFQARSIAIIIQVSERRWMIMWCCIAVVVAHFLCIADSPISAKLHTHKHRTGIPTRYVPFDRLNCDAEAKGHQEDGIDQGAQDFGARPSERVL